MKKLSCSDAKNAFIKLKWKNNKKYGFTLILFYSLKLARNLNF